MRVPQDAAGGYAKLTLTLAGMKSDEMIPAVIEALILGEDTDLPAIRAAAKEALPTLVAALNSERFDAENAAEALGLFGPAAKDAVPALAQALDDDEYSIREENARALIRIAPPSEVVPMLIQLLNHEDPNRATIAAKALGSLGPQAKAAAPVLRQCLNIEPVYDKSGLNDKYRWLRYASSSALGQIGTASEESVPALIALLTHEDEYARRDAVLALGVIGPDAKPAVPALIRVLNRRGHAATAVIETLGRMGLAASDAIPALERLANNESRDYHSQQLRKHAADALEMIRLMRSE